MAKREVIAVVTVATSHGRYRPGEKFHEHEDYAKVLVDAGHVKYAEPANDEEKASGGNLEWTMKTAPDAYLKQFPNGPKAALARAVLEQAAKAAPVKEDDRGEDE